MTDTAASGLLNNKCSHTPTHRHTHNIYSIYVTDAYATGLSPVPHNVSTLMIFSFCDYWLKTVTTMEITTYNDSGILKTPTKLLDTNGVP